MAIIGCIVQLGFGVWHFAVPNLYDWYTYLQDIPQELINGINATNFFLSALMTLTAIYAMYIFITSWDLIKNRDALLIILSILWVSRTGYQLVVPQGTMIPGLSTVLLVVFGLTALTFIIPLLGRE
ncbi:MAG: conserved membrane protein of unknown function [Candidatus Thorarchaeota archaeon]|nr:MAG: conserved membrane protein of unknown function [Candidatus Thorarchaeota archaeon]